MLRVHDGHKNARRFFGSRNAASYDSVVRLTTFGKDLMWKKQIMNIIRLDTKKRENFSETVILDLACGTGILSSMLLDTRPNIKNIIGLDLTFDYLEVAKNKIKCKNIVADNDKPFLFANSTAEVIPFKNKCFDIITSSYMAKYIDIQRVVDECWRVMKHNGIIVVHDFTYPQNTLFQSFWNFYFVILQFAGNFIKSWETVFRELCQVIKTSKWVEQTLYALNEKGFENIMCNYYTCDTSAIISAVKP